jgi:hypothetical protein
VGVEIVKLDLDTLPILPNDPPAAGPDRALPATGPAFAKPVALALEFELMLA